VAHSRQRLHSALTYPASEAFEAAQALLPRPAPVSRVEASMPALVIGASLWTKRDRKWDGRLRGRSARGRPQTRRRRRPVERLRGLTLAASRNGGFGAVDASPCPLPTSAYRRVVWNGRIHRLQ
jgi:hypothetical protein